MVNVTTQPDGTTVITQVAADGEKVRDVQGSLTLTPPEVAQVRSTLVRLTRPPLHAPLAGGAVRTQMPRAAAPPVDRNTATSPEEKLAAVTGAGTVNTVHVAEDGTETPHAENAVTRRAAPGVSTDAAPAVPNAPAVAAAPTGRSGYSNQGA